MKIGILYICTGKYSIFWKDFYLSSEKYLLKEYEKHYFIFTDSNNIFDSKNNKNIHIFRQENLGWPDNTLMRFDIFLYQKNELNKMDYLFFFNANLEIKKEIGDEIFPNIEEKIVVTKHPGFYNKSNKKFTYERIPKSTAYIQKGKGSIYIAGGLNGGISKHFINMCEILSQNIQQDKKNGIIALWHDESHLNHYILNHNYKLLDPSYLYPEGWNIPFDCKILIRDKSKYIDVNNIKGYKNHNSIFIKNILLLFIKYLYNLYNHLSNR